MNEKYFKNKIRKLKKHIWKKGLSYTLTKAKLKELVENPICFYCKSICFVGLNTDEFKGNDEIRNLIHSIDRIDPLSGYSDDNVVSCCLGCNERKGRHEDAQIWEKYIRANQKDMDSIFCMAS